MRFSEVPWEMMDFDAPEISFQFDTRNPRTRPCAAMLGCARPLFPHREQQYTPSALCTVSFVYHNSIIRMSA